MTLAIVAGLAMAAGDSLNALYVLLLDRHPWWAGHFDGLNDLTTVVSIGGGASTVYHHRIDLTTVATLAFIYAGSVVGARLGRWLEEHLAGHLRSV